MALSQFEFDQTTHKGRSLTTVDRGSLGTMLEVRVSDSGPGMTEEIRNRVFEPYFTLKPTGTGLGLAITRGVVEEHGGKIEIASSEGHGTQVLITLPIERPIP